MTEPLNALLVVVLALNLFALGNGRIRTVIRIVAAQGAVIAVIPLALHGRVTPASAAAAAAALLLKAVAIPAVMRNSLESAEQKREDEPLVGVLPSILLGALSTAAALILSAKLPAGGQGRALIVPTSIATVLAGFILLVTRYKALSQVLGYLVLENGIYVFGMLLVEAIPLVVEMGMLLDLFVGVFVISIITNHINEAFSSMDTRRLVSLKE